VGCGGEAWLGRVLGGGRLVWGHCFHYGAIGDGMQITVSLCCRCSSQSLTHRSKTSKVV